MAIDHMIKVMRGVVKSRRHDLFLDKRERDQCSGSETSRLYQLSNPGFLGGGGEKDTVVIKHLIHRVFMVNFHQADAKLRELGISSAFVYTSCVLFPETFIHQHQVNPEAFEYCLHLIILIFRFRARAERRLNNHLWRLL